MSSLLVDLRERYDRSNFLDNSVLVALDNFSQCLSLKENEARFPEDYGPVELTHEEKVFFEVWGAWTMACNGGTTEALHCRDVEFLTQALGEIGASEIIEAIIRHDRNLREFEEKCRGLGWIERDEKRCQMSIGPWREDENVLLEPEERIPRLLIEYAIRNQDRISIDGFHP